MNVTSHNISANNIEKGFNFFKNTLEKYLASDNLFFAETPLQQKSGKEKRERREKMDAFIHSTSLRKFYDNAIKVLFSLEHRDIKSLAADEPSLAAKQFLNLFDTLEANGVEGLRGREIHFWSGDMAHTHLSNPLSINIDTKIPAHNVLLNFTRSLSPEAKEEQEQYEEKRYLFIFAMSTHLASQAHGDVHVFISDMASSIKGRKLSVGNYFWNAELPTLQSRKQTGQVKNILLFFEDPTTPYGFAQPIEASSPESDAIKLVRVHKVPTKESSNPNPYSGVRKTFLMAPVAAPCRLTMGDMRRIIKKWRTYKKT